MLTSYPITKPIKPPYGYTLAPEAPETPDVYSKITHDLFIISQLFSPDDRNRVLISLTEVADYPNQTINIVYSEVVHEDYSITRQLVAQFFDQSNTRYKLVQMCSDLDIPFGNMIIDSTNCVNLINDSHEIREEFSPLFIQESNEIMRLLNLSE